MEAAKRLLANPKYAGHPCGWCQQTLAVGEPIAVCNACQTVAHDACWDGKMGCSKSGCANAPLDQLDPQPAFAAASAAPKHYIVCNQCHSQTPADSSFCNACGQPPVAFGPPQTAPGAVASLVLGILSLFICGVVLGIIAIVQGTQANRIIRENPGMYSGGGMATAGLVLGIIGLIGWAIIMMLRFAV